MEGKRKTAVVSGGLGGVGRSVCVQLAEEGFDVIALYFHTSPEVADAWIATLALGNHRAIKCDIRDGASVETLFNEVQKTHGDVYACIHAAVDSIARKDLLVMDADELKQQLETSFIGGFNVLQSAAHAMKRTGEGRIVGILSRYLFTNTPHKKMAGYLLAKHALRGLLREWHLELASTNIVVSALAPEFLDTNLSADLPESVREFIKTRGVYGSMKTVDDVARAVRYLCSEAGSAERGKVYSFEAEDITPL